MTTKTDTAATSPPAATPDLCNQDRQTAGDSTAAPHVAPGGRSYSPDLSTIDISGHNFAANPKFRNIQTNPQAAFVVDDAGLIVRQSPQETHVRR